MFRMKALRSTYIRNEGRPIDLDETDFAILDALRNNARLSNKELAASVDACAFELLGTRSKINPTQGNSRISCRGRSKGIGIGLQGIISVRLAKHSQSRFRSLFAYVQQLIEVLQVFQVTGANDLLIHVAVADVDHLRDLVVDRLATRPEVAACETSVIFLSSRKSVLPRYVRN